MSEHRIRAPRRFVYGLWLAAISLVLVALSAANYLSYKRNFRTEVGRRLATISTLKAHELHEWRTERLIDGRMFYDNLSFLQLVERWRADNALSGQIQEWLHKLRELGAYDEALLLDPQGQPLLSAADLPGEVDPGVQAAARAAYSADQMVFHDFYRDANDKLIHLAILVPVRAPIGDQERGGVLLLRIDPRQYLYPFINRWPTESSTAETLLVRREAESVLFLNELRFDRSAALALRYPLSQTKIPAVRAALGQEGLLEGVDYQGKAVLADLLAVQDSPWRIVTKISVEEAYAPLEERFRGTLALTSSVLLCAMVGMGLLWRTRQATYLHELYETEAKLRLTERFLGESQAAAGIGSYTLNLATGTWVCSKTLDEIFGIDEHYEHSIATWTKLLHPDWRESMNQYFAETVINGRTNFDREYRIVRQRDGASLWVHGLGRLEYDAHKQPIRMIGTIQDITTRRQKHEILQARVRLLEFAQTHNIDECVKKGLEEVEALTESPASYMHLVDSDQRSLQLRTWSPHIRWNFNPCENGNRVFPLGQTGLLAEAIAQRRAVMQDEGAGTPAQSADPAEVRREMVVPVVWESKVQAVMGVGNKAKPYQAADAEMVQFIADVAWQIIRTKQHEQELRDKNIELERFTYTVSHDLKSPLITIKGFAGALLRDIAAGKHDRLQGDLRRVAEAADKMGDLLADLLELSRIGRIMQPPTEVNLNKLLLEVVEQLNGPITQRGAQVTVQGHLPMVWADGRRLGEVWQNLIENALKFSGKQRPPEIEIGMRGTGADRVYFVRDNGIGIEPRYQETVFGLFNKLDAHTEGTGIGLALVRRIIEMHGGRIWIESQGAGTGTTFCFTLPSSPPPPKHL